MASILRRGDSYSVRFKYKDHAGRICEGWESFKTKKEAQDLGRERTLGRYVPHTRCNDGSGNAVQVAPHPVQQAQVGTQNLHPHGSHDSESCRALSRQEADSEGSDV